MPADRLILVTGATGYVGGRLLPRWVRVTAQPIAISDALDYLRAALTVETGNRSLIIEIGGPDRVSYGELMHEYARQRGLRRWVIPVPVLTPRLSSLWLGLVTPLYARVGRKLIDSLRHPTVVRDDTAKRLFPIQPLGGGTRLRQTATFDPLGLWGLAYWYGVWPLHRLVFAGMLRGIARAAEKSVDEPRLREHANHAD